MGMFASEGGGGVALDTPLAMQAAIYENIVAMAANDVDLALGNLFTKTITTATTFTVSNVPVAPASCSFILELVNAGSQLITWWSSIKWANGQAPTLTITGTDLIGFETHDGGTTWKGVVVGLDVK